MNTYLNNLNKLVYRAKKIKKEDVKFEYINEVLAYASFIYYSGDISEKDYYKAIGSLVDSSFEKIYQVGRNISINKLLDNNDLLNEFYNKVISIYENYKLEKKDNLESNKNIEKYFIDFLKYMGCYDLYQELDNKKRISYKSPILDYSTCIGNRKDSYIIIKENDNVYRYITLVHELGHAFENRVLNRHKEYFCTTCAKEISSITFSRIFLEYLKENNALTRDEINIIKNNMEFNAFHFIEWSYLITLAIKYNNFAIDDYNINLYLNDYETKRNLTDHNYSLGSIFSLSLLGMWRKGDKKFIADIPSMLFFLNKMSLKEMINLFSKYDSIDKELSKILIKKVD